MRKLSVAVLTGGLLATVLPAAWANLKDQQGASGSLVIKSPEGSYVSAADLKPGCWLRAQGDDAVLSAGGVRVRMTAGTTAKVAAVSPDSLQLNLGKKPGRLFVSVDKGAHVDIVSNGQSVRATDAEFVLKHAEKDALRVFSGNASTTSKEAPYALAGKWLKRSELLAADVDGPDLRRRRVSPEQVPPPSAGEDVTPSQSPTMAPTETYTPPPEETYSPSPVPSSPAPFTPSSSPSGGTVSEEGGFPWEYVAGVAGAIGLGFGIDAILNDEEDNQIIIPISP